MWGGGGGRGGGSCFCETVRTATCTFVPVWTFIPSGLDRDRRWKLNSRGRYFCFRLKLLFICFLPAEETFKKIDAVSRM